MKTELPEEKALSLASLLPPLDNAEEVITGTLEASSQEITNLRREINILWTAKRDTNNNKKKSESLLMTRASELTLGPLLNFS